MKKTLKILKNLKKHQDRIVGCYRFFNSLYTLDVIIIEIQANTKLGKEFVKELNK